MSTVPSPDLCCSPARTLLPTGMPAVGNTLHVWWMCPPDGNAFLAREQRDSWWDLLSPDELARAKRFHFSHHAEEWVSNRARLRILLASYLQQNGKDIEFTYDDRGKPKIAGSGTSIEFNMSHTSGLAVVAVVQGCRVGIDVENTAGLRDAMDLAKFAFSPAEVTALEHLDSAQQQGAAFLRLWTCKEAFLKGLGDGLARPLAGFSVAIDQTDPVLTECMWDAPLVDRWQMFALQAPNGFVASLALEDSSRRPLQTFFWRPESSPQ